MCSSSNFDLSSVIYCASTRLPSFPLLPPPPPHSLPLLLQTMQYDLGDATKWEFFFPNVEKPLLVVPGEEMEGGEEGEEEKVSEEKYSNWWAAHTLTHTHTHTHTHTLPHNKEEEEELKHDFDLPPSWVLPLDISPTGTNSHTPYSSYLLTASLSLSLSPMQTLKVGFQGAARSCCIGKPNRRSLQSTSTKMDWCQGSLAITIQQVSATMECGSVGGSGESRLTQGLGTRLCRCL